MCMWGGWKGGRTHSHTVGKPNPHKPPKVTIIYQVNQNPFLWASIQLRLVRNVYNLKLTTSHWSQRLAIKTLVFPLVAAKIQQQFLGMLWVIHNSHAWLLCPDKLTLIDKSWSVWAQWTIILHFSITQSYLFLVSAPRMRKRLLSSYYWVMAPIVPHHGLELMRAAG